jgi:uncharacterized protein (TIGR00369 family)
MLDWGRKVLASQPFSLLLGAELVAFSPGSAELRIQIKPELKQQNGFVHGGVISYAADNALTYAGGSALGPGVVTSEFKINYVRPALGDVLIARATRRSLRQAPGGLSVRRVCLQPRHREPVRNRPGHDYATRAAVRHEILTSDALRVSGPAKSSRHTARSR